MIKRQITEHLQNMLTMFPVVSLTGPRQSGKTTLLKAAFPDYKYFNLERIDLRDFIRTDPNGFLNNAGHKVIFDEAQQVPELFSYIQVVSDERNTNGQFILSGSQSFILSNQISQSLAGRVSINHLFPFDYSEMNGIVDLSDINSTIINGFYPRLISQNIKPDDFYPSYLQTYIERDVRTLNSIANLSAFSRFLGLCAGRTGQILNLTSLASDAGISVNTAKSWLSLLESSFIIFLLQPYYRNFNKRIIKAPKLYFYDTGVVSSLLRISADQLQTHYLYGSLFENLVISEIIKKQVHSGRVPSVFYWRESNGNEIDCIIEKSADEIILLEIKAGQTYNSDYLKNLNRFPEDEFYGTTNKCLIYSGKETSYIAGVQIFTWEKFASLLEVTSHRK